MIRSLARLAVAGGIGAVLADRWLAANRKREPIRTEVLIDAPPEDVWAVATDIRGQPRWMRDLVAVRLHDDGPVVVGTRATGTIRLLGIEVQDPITVTAFDAPHRFALSHEGAYTGDGVMTFEPVGSGSTRVTWVEQLRSPLLPDLAAAVQGPLFRIVFEADLQRLKRLIETGSTDGPEPPLVRLLHA